MVGMFAKQPSYEQAKTSDFFVKRVLQQKSFLFFEPKVLDES